MKKVFYCVVAVLAMAGCAKNETPVFEETGIKGLAKQVQVNIADFVSADSPATKAEVTTAGAFTWSDTDIIGVWPMTVTPPQTPQQLYLNYNTGDGASATFSGSGWGMHCNGNYTYAAYYPFDNSDGVSETAIPFTYPSNLIEANNDITQVYPYLYMYGPAITPADTDGATFNFYQFSALAKIVITLPVDAYYTKVVVKANAAVFTTEGEYNLTTASKTDVPASLTPPTFTSTTMVDRFGFVVNQYMGEGQILTLWMPMCPADLQGKTLTVTLYDANNNTYIQTKTCLKNQVSGMMYSYTFSEVAKDNTRNPYSDAVKGTIQAVDLGNPNYYFANMNLGATSPEEAGDYFAWGGVTKQNNYLDSVFPGYTADASTAPYLPSDAEHDAAVKNWPDGWIIPNYETMWTWLTINCNFTRTVYNGLPVYKVQSKSNSNYIYIPIASSSMSGTRPVSNSNSYYITSKNFNAGYAYAAIFYLEPQSYSVGYGSTERKWIGGVVRPVKAKP